MQPDGAHHHLLAFLQFVRSGIQFGGHRPSLFLEWRRMCAIPSSI
jgi:hypothetical protein